MNGNKHGSAETAWQHEHRAALQARFAPLLALPDGTLEETQSAWHRIRIIKHHGQIHFYFVNNNGSLDGPMSRVALHEPLRLLAEYTQAALLGLLWKPNPQRICLVGLAGGRLSLVCYHHMPDAVIDNIELDPAIPPLAERYFGVTFDQRQRLVVADARAALANEGPVYDMIVMDAFRDATDNLEELATQAFYADCKRRLARGGVVVANMLASDPLFPQKVATFAASFAHSYGVPHKHGVVLFGNDWSRMNGQEAMRRAKQVQDQRNFAFPFEQRAAELVKANELRRLHTIQAAP